MQASGMYYRRKRFGQTFKSKFYTLITKGFSTLMLIYISAIVMLIAGTLLAAGYYEKKAAIILLLVFILITISVQLDNLKDLGPFFKNYGIQYTENGFIKAFELQKAGYLSVEL